MTTSGPSRLQPIPTRLTPALVAILARMVEAKLAAEERRSTGQESVGR